MKRHIAIFLLTALILAGCAADAAETTPTDPTQPLPTEPAMPTGFFTEAGKTYYRTASGTLHTGWLEVDGTRYYLDEAGVLQTGWLTLGTQTYYLDANGAISRGAVEIEGKNYCFSTEGVYVVMANPWNPVPDSYEAELVEAERGYQVDACCVDALMQMLTDCRAAGYNAQIASAYRSREHQQRLYDKKVQYYIDKGYSKATAEQKAGRSVAPPGTSEHELGLAVDLVDAGYWVLDKKQENTAAQKWLMAHCWEYGFILRYPNGKSESTGIIYEPWHYRYVGKALAAELQSAGLCLEEYFLSIK